MATVFERIRNVLVELLGVETSAVTLESTFVGDLGCDSLDLVELVIAIEDEFNVEICDDEAELIVTVSDAVREVERLVGEAA
ncbi:acyl carrier protein [Brucella intermedia GD04153]|uniref:Acyl carrier protein n=1 Tax=Brucella intermedia GD04153 TaxID=2975438 RepID=A0AA42HAT6_9HYPH|nr:acyl carrier protein [Brucella intermedia]MDH0126651.1 acyl carrier protein [Brucella intermedia GD04153]